jgi:ribulose-5-phosphate 4-epimerase/fuculose-1-phosphate aldolase
MDIVKFIEEIIATALKALHDQPLDERSAGIIAALKEEHLVQLENAKQQFSATLNQLEADYKQQLEEQDQVSEDLRTQLAEANEIAQDALKGFNETAVKLPNSFEAEVKGKKVKVNHGVFFNGKNYTAQDLVDDTEVIEELLAIGSGSITLID